MVVVMKNMSLKQTVIKYSLLYIMVVLLHIKLVFSAEFNNTELTEYHDFTKLMFSSKIIDNSNINNQLLVVKNNNAFIRESNKHSFTYTKVKDICYKLENMCVVCIKNNKIYNIVCNTNRKNTEILTGLMIGDPFFNENNNDCNNMKFNVINNYFVNNQTITYAIYQLFLVGYYDVARLVLFKNNNITVDNLGDHHDDYNIDATLTKNQNINSLIENNAVQAFIVSSKNDVSCSPYDKFLIHNHKSLYVLNEENKKNKNKNKKKKIKNNQNAEDYKYIYGRIALKGYQHLQKYENIKDLSNVVIVLQNDKVKEINIVALEFKWDKIKGQQLLEPYSFEYKLPTENANNNTNNTLKKASRN